ncbi:MAG: kelch repeat-containing protein [Candidatus Limnocylindrales bacterium]
MAQQALGTGMIVPRKRAMFGLLDADGWAWAGIKAFIWLILIILLLGYIPDRAYYLTVNRTVDLGVLAWSPINLCPPGNESLPCPAPVGAVVPWHPSPEQLALPKARTDGNVVQVGKKLLYIGGSDGKAAQTSVFVAEVVPTGNFDRWADGPALPEPRSDASVVVVAGVIYVIGGYDAEGKPTDTAFSLKVDAQTGALEDWTPIEGPEVAGGTCRRRRVGLAGRHPPAGRHGARGHRRHDLEEPAQDGRDPREVGSRDTARPRGLRRRRGRPW